MDTGLKKFNRLTITKIIAVVLCLLCVSGMASQLATSLCKAYEGDLVYVNFTDAVKYKILDIDEDEWQYQTFRNGYTHLLSLLDIKMRDYGNGTQEDYKKRANAFEKQRKAIIALNKNNVIAAASNDFYDFYDFYSSGLIEITGTDVIGETNDTTEYYDHQFEYNISFYNYSEYNGNYNEPVLPVSVSEEFKTIKYDGVMYIDNTRKILEDDADEEYVVKETFTPGYYAFKVNDTVLEEELYKNNMISTYFSSYEEFYQSYLDIENQIIHHAETARYFIRDKNGNVITNLDTLKADSTAEEIKKVFSAFGTYSYSEDDMIYLNNGRVYSGTYMDWLSNDDVYYEETVIRTTMPEATDIDTFSMETTSKETNSMETTVIENIRGESEAVTVAVAIPETTRVSVRVSQSSNITDSDYELYIGIDPEAESQTCHFAALRSNVEKAAEHIEDCVYTCGILGTVLLICFIYLIVVTGRRKGSTEIYLYRTDKIFIEIRTAIDCGLGFLCVMGIIGCIDLLVDSAMSSVLIFLTILLADILFLLVLDLVLFFARHIKNRSVLKNISVIWLIGKLWKYGKKMTTTLKDKLLFTKELKTTVIIRTAIAVVINILVGAAIFFFVIGGAAEIGLLVLTGLFLFDLFIVYRGLKFVGGVHKLFNLVKEMHDGNLDINVNKNVLPEYLMIPAENLQCLSEGMKEAVNEAIKQERTKTELITNVSHDLKTPLTSIINYVDLLKKCDITDETAVSYLNVLSEKSDRLKILIEDLVEASKASAGAIPVNFVSVSLKELINQILGEFEESFEDKNLHLVLDMPETDIRIKADSKLIYRVLENLFVNIRKYAMENTRVYITLSEKNNKGIINLKNISAAPLNISADELKERFVRGEQSRTTEGNGLGLSIAENLCTLQNGSLKIEINGDLFIVTVEMEQTKGYINI